MYDTYFVVLLKRRVTSLERGLSCPKLRVGARGSEMGLSSYEKPNIESVPHAFRVVL